MKLTRTVSVSPFSIGRLKKIVRDQVAEHSVPKGIARRVFLSHFLCSTWRLTLQYPGTLLPVSLYAFTRGVSAIVFASAVGQYIDISNRLQVVRQSIGV